MTQEDFYLQAGVRHTNGESWRELIEDFYNQFNQMLSVDAIRKRVKRVCNRQNNSNQTTQQTGCSISRDYEAHNKDGSIDATKTVLDNVFSLGGDKSKILNYLGYSDKEWELVSWRISQWDGGAGGAPRYSLQYRLEPKCLSYVNYLEEAKKIFQQEIEPVTIKAIKEITGLKNQKLMEIPPIELHLGKISDSIQTGEEYTLEIAKKRFYDICENIIRKQSIEKCGKCLVVVGSDFFNSESDYCTSVHKIPQQNSHGYIKLFDEGLKMYLSFILTLKKYFNTVDIMLCAGNHARAMETYLYFALQQRFFDDKTVNFIENYKQTQCYSFGDCAIFYNHGDVKLAQIIKSIPAEFYSEWGSHKFRELHLGHLHKEVTVDDEGGMITRRIGSPCSTDAWHAENRYVGATKKHEVFIWHTKFGLEQVYYINTRV